AMRSFVDTLTHTYKAEREREARQFLYGFDNTNELNIKAHLLKGYAEDSNGSFVSKLIANGLFTVFVEEAWKNNEAAREALNDLLSTSKKRPIHKEVAVDPDVNKLKRYLENCLSFEKFRPDEKNSRDLRDMRIEGQFFARALTIK